MSFVAQYLRDRSEINAGLASWCPSEHFSIRLAPTLLSSPGSSGRSSKHRPWILDCPDKPGNDLVGSGQQKNTSALLKARPLMHGLDSGDQTSPEPRLRVAVDGVFFQYRSSGIARVWTALLEEWAKSGFIDHVIFLDRGGVDVPQIRGLRCERIVAHDYARTGADSLELERICREVDADLFVSTYYTTPTATPSVFFGYDMIPEMIGADLSQEGWREKRRAILHASARLMISENSARDLERIYGLPQGSTHVAHCGVWKSFYPPSPQEVTSLRKKYGLSEQPYVLTVGDRVGVDGYKNGELAFKAIGRLPDPTRITVVCVGGSPIIEHRFAAVAPNTRMIRLALDDDELRAAYGGAHAFLYPSRYEGFGMPVLEAMASGAPVVTCRNSSITEIAGDAALFVGEDDVDGMAHAIERLGDRTVREAFIARGAAQAPQFSFTDMARRVADALISTHHGLSSGELARPSAVWQDLRETLQRSQTPQAYKLALRQELRRWSLVMLRKIGFDPERNRPWARFRELQRDPERWTTITSAVLRKVRRGF
jgi:glycosyltransferase involved in cell wall biosynthesis